MAELELPRGPGRCVRVRRETYKGRPSTHLREWYQDDAGTWRPGKGVTLRDDELVSVAKALSGIAAEVERG